MISVLNRRQLLSGNRLSIIALLFLASCAPKIVPVKENKPPVVTSEPSKPVEKSAKAASSTIGLLLPFQLKQTGTPDKADVERAEMAIEFYQGFKLGIDSAAIGGQDFKISVVDSKTASQKIAVIIKQSELDDADLVVGPVFPESLKQLSGLNSNQYFVSPLAASMPDEFNTPRLISMIPNINVHAGKLLDYIKRKYNSENTIVVLINPKNPESEQLGGRIRTLAQLAAAKINFQEYQTVEALETKFQKGKQYAVIITSSDRNFVVPALDKLAKIKKRLGYQLDVYGHPNWSKQNYDTENLQYLNTTITSSYRVNYKRNAVINFVKKYRKDYGFEPGEYAFKGFDTGFYFGKLIAKYGKDYAGYITKERLTGLQNSYSFIKDEKFGYINTGLMLVRYKNFAWGVVE